ncbi:MAG: hypothetical protein GWM88_09935 [Pseudomonadales bacterium]|nr:hypothetical protein [Pseudomonadales bacterium]NIX08297.1 hypothetical protein [Pseudomonadales bacterium]
MKKWLVGLLLAGLSLPAAAYREATLPFGVRVQGIENRLAEFGVYARPGEVLALDLLDVAPADVGATFDSAPVKTGHGQINLKMPSTPGTHQVKLTDRRNGTQMRLNVFVMWQHDGAHGDVLNGYRIGQYPRDPFRGLAVYRRPEAFVEVTAKNADMRVSPNFTLGQFVCKQGSGFPKYVVLRPQLLQKLELVLGELNAVNPDITGLTVMSGYRTPAYNRSLGNGRHSRHLWGGAADVYVDANGDGIMDDLNGDGRRDRGDAEWLANFIDALERTGRFGEHIGGIGTYDSNAHRGPFVHVDARGYRARW